MQTNQRAGPRGLFMDPHFYLFMKLLSAFFSFLCQDANKTRWNCAIIGCSLSKKHKLTLYKTQNGEIISFSLIFTRSYLPVQNLGDRRPNTIELAGCLVHVVCDVNATWHREVYFSVSWIHHGSTSCWCLYFTFLAKVLPPPFHYSLGSYF